MAQRRGPGYDYFVDAANGNDANDGQSSATPWASLETNLTADILVPGKKVRVHVMAGTYTDQAICIINATGKGGAILEVNFESGCVIDWTLGTDKSCVDVQGDQEWTLVLTGNGSTIQGFNFGTGNGLGSRSGGLLIARDFFIDDCVDGISAHGSGRIYAYGCFVTGCSKSCFAHIETSQTYHSGCTFEAASGATLGIGATVATGEAYFTDCKLIPYASGGIVDLSGATVFRCQIGTLTARVDVNCGAAGTVTKSFVNVYVDGNKVISFTECFGLFSTRVRNGGTISVTNCVFSGPATGQTNTVFSNFNPGSGSKLVISDTIFAGAWTFMSVDATNAGYLVAAESEFFNNILYPSLAYDADLIAADSGGTVVVDTITDNPLIGSADSYLMADYAYGTGSPAIGAGTTGNIGFGVDDVEELAA